MQWVHHLANHFNTIPENESNKLRLSALRTPSSALYSDIGLVGALYTIAFEFASRGRAQFLMSSFRALHFVVALSVGLSLGGLAFRE